jgi:hypothetical protein
MMLLLFLLLSLLVAQVCLQAIQSRVPNVAVGRQPCVKLLERLGPQLVDALLSDRMRLDDPSIAEHTKVFRDLRLTEPKAFGGFPYRTGSITQEFDNVQSVWFS